MSSPGVPSELRQAVGKPLERNVFFSRMTTIGCGGPAALVAEIDTAARLSATLEAAEELKLPWFILGLGSNLLVADEGWDGLVLKLTGNLRKCSLRGNTLYCGGGVPLPTAAREAAAAGLSGLEPLAGIPGTVGGAVAMNAGAFGMCMGDILEEVSVCLPGEIRAIERDSLQLGYRNSNLPAGSVVSRVLFSLSPAGTSEIRAAMADYRKRREAHQPQAIRSFGSAFINPPGDESAGALLDRAGCKGLQQGAAYVSEVHANFIVNRGGATAADIVALMDRCRRLVHERFGIVLEPEVKFLGGIGLEDIP